MPSYLTVGPEVPMMVSIGYDGLTVPEAATLALLGVGMAALLAVRRRRNLSHQQPTLPRAAALSRSRRSAPGSASQIHRR